MPSEVTITFSFSTGSASGIPINPSSLATSIPERLEYTRDTQGNVILVSKHMNEMLRCHLDEYSPQITKHYTADDRNIEPDL